MKRTRALLIAVLTAVTGIAASVMPVAAATQANEECRPDGLYRPAGLNVPYCQVYDTAGREKLGGERTRRAIGYFTSWRTGRNGAPAYLAHNIPWDKVTHINYAFGHVGTDNRVSVGPDGPDNPSTGMEWPGVPGAEMDPTLPYKGHFNQLTKFKKQHPHVKTLISVGGWAESGGILNPDGTRNPTGGFYKLAQSQAAIDTFADSMVQFLRTYGFDGADIDYEYATSAPYAGHPEDYWISNPNRGQLMRGYVNLMKTLRDKLDAASAADGKYYQLTAAVSASGWILRGAETYQVTQYLDFVNMMTYDLHGSWNQYAGPNAALYDDGKDAELDFWDVYTTPQYEGIGHLNTDWAYHYFRGAMPAGRINIGVPFYTRGWQGVTGGTNGLWGTAPLPDQTQCPPGTGGNVGSQVPCGNGAVGIDNLWHDETAAGDEVPSGVNPMWHAKNLEKGITPDYLDDYGLDPNDPKNQLTGTYTRHYDQTLTAPWLWNERKKVFLSTEDEQSLAAKMRYVADKGLGGVMIWELAGDYAFDQTTGQYFMGQTLINTITDGLRGAAPYGNTKGSGPAPAQVLDVGVELTGFALGDANYPINPKMRFTNRSTRTIPGGARIEFDYGTSAPGSMADQSGMGLRVTSKGHSGPNVGGLKGDFQRASFTVPSWSSIPAGGSLEMQVRYYLPIATPSNFRVTFGGTTYGLTADHPRRTP
ncbi:chitinase C-terminal domain-containing protein [Amycolatopsis suaedae]|nr:glycosyl hydrolase family 18 protein [Amycolatopsis suaedae]